MAKSKTPEQTPFEFTTAQIDQYLQTGEHAEALAGYFGPELYRKLQTLARTPIRRAVRGGARVLILPGIMASTLGTRRALIDKVVWINPARLATGQASELSFNEDPILHESLDALPYFYYFLRKRLTAEGYQVDYFHYDWRYDLRTTADRLIDVINNDAADKVNLIAHSMGGLVARLALHDETANAKIERLIMLGTPNHGSFNALQVFDGTHSITQKVEQMDLRHDMTELVEGVFATLPAVYQLFPFVSKYNRPEFYDRAAWPTNLPLPWQEHLDRAKVLADEYPDPDERHFLIASTAHPTYVGASLTNDGIVYELADASGDGTVPLDSALLPGVKTRFVQEEHQNLAKDDVAIETVVELLQTVPADWTGEAPPATRGTRQRRNVSTADLHAVPLRSLSTQAGDLRTMLDGVFGRAVVPDMATTTTPAPAAVANASGLAGLQLRGLTVGERPRRRIDITLVRGDMTTVEAPVGVVGMFQNVQPNGAARVLDEKMNGALGEIFNRRMFDAQTGEIFILPTPTRRVGSDMILFAGLGSFDQLDAQAYQFTAANVIRTLIRCRVTELATVVFGANSSMTPEDALQNMLRGFWAGLTDADPEQRFRRIFLCEIDGDRFRKMKEELLRLSLSGFFHPVEVVLDELMLDTPETTRAAKAAPAVVARPQAYLSVRSTLDDTTHHFDYSLLTTGGKATVFQEQAHFTKEQLDKLLSRLDEYPIDVNAVGKELTELLLPPGLREILLAPSLADAHLTVINDTGAARIPWETLRLKNHQPALRGGMSRQYATGGMSVTKWLEQQRNQKKLRIQLIINPTKDLKGADQEGAAIQAALAGVANIELAPVLMHGQATRKAIVDCFASGSFDVVHYAGHAVYVTGDPNRSGIKCADGMLTGADLASLPALPTLMFFNACQSGRVRGKKIDLDAQQRLDRTVSFAEAFLINGVAHLLGTYWEVDDTAAETFAKVFYGDLAQASTVGQALQNARKALHAKSLFDWANYIHYGEPNFSIKKPS